MSTQKKATKKTLAPRIPFDDIPVEQLIVDDRNPRFATPAAQAELYAKYANSQKTQRLAKHLVDHGIDPLSVLGVNKAGPKRFTVREGNRRTAALRLLHDPHLAGSEKLTKRFQDIRERGTYLPPTKIRCAIFPQAEDAHEWMRVKHSGAQDGIGTENWSPLQTSRFNTRTGRDHQYAFAQQVIDEAIDDGILSEEEAGEVATSSLARVLNDSVVQKILHVKVTTDGLGFGVDTDSLERLTRRLIKDWSKGGKTVREIDSGEQRRGYAQQIAEELQLKPVAAGKARTAKTAAAHGSHSTTKSTRTSGPRRTLIPNKFPFDGRKAMPRIDKIVGELRGLDVNRYANAVSMLFRLFVEASVDHYNEGKKVTLKRDRDDHLPKLSVRVEAALEHLRIHNPSAKQALKNVKTAFGERSGLFALATLHEYVHNATWQPVPDNLRTHWDNYSEFLRLLWE